MYSGEVICYKEGPHGPHSIIPGTSFFCGGTYHLYENGDKFAELESWWKEQQYRDWIEYRKGRYKL